MANALFEKGRDNFARGQIDWVNHDIRAVLIDVQDYTVDLVNHASLGSVPAAARVATATLTNKTTNGRGTLDCDDLTFVSVTGDQSEALLFYKFVNDGSGAPDPNLSLLILWMDTSPGLPVIPNGGDINVAISSSGLFKL